MRDVAVRIVGQWLVAAERKRMDQSKAGDNPPPYEKRTEILNALSFFFWGGESDIREHMECSSTMKDLFLNGIPTPTL